MRKLVVALLVLVVLAVVLDRVAVAGVQREIAKQVQASADLDAPPTVQVKGVPFLTQAIGGRYEEIAIDIGDIQREGIRLSDVQATLYGVKAPLMDLIQNAAGAEIVAERVSGTVTISEETLNSRAPRGIKIEGGGGNGTVRVSGEVTALGNQVPVTADMKIEVKDGVLRLTPAKVTIAGGFTVPNAERLITFTVPVQGLPLDLKIDEVRSAPGGGLVVDATATDVPLSR
ncbi:DUF2993 domain-containing protein [Herbidospora cretacea]|uniref:LmeA family phospholipid-binding protein n=1 Tax=Herbidospora cretacea TaxID=28444 RepID=UPI0004C460BF|nr:DUF2993 domain-containing protein [Herbidospora cretacea]